MLARTQAANIHWRLMVSLLEELRAELIFVGAGTGEECCREGCFDEGAFSSTAKSFSPRHETWKPAVRQSVANSSGR